MDVGLDRLRADVQALADAPVRQSLRDQREHLALALGQVAERGARRRRAQQVRHDRRVDDALARRDATHRIDDHAAVGHALLEQVADPRRVLLDQAHRVADVEVLRQHEDAGRRVLGTDPLRRDQALVGVRRRHLDVDHRHIGLGELDAAHQLRRVAHTAGDRHPGTLEQARQPVAQEHRVVGDDHLQPVVHTAIIAEKTAAAH